MVIGLAPFVARKLNMTAVSVPFLLADVVASVDSFRCIHGLAEEGGCVGIIKALLGRGVKPFGCVLACVPFCARMP